MFNLIHSDDTRCYLNAALGSFAAVFIAVVENAFASIHRWDLANRLSSDFILVVTVYMH